MAAGLMVGQGLEASVSQPSGEIGRTVGRDAFAATFPPGKALRSAKSIVVTGYGDREGEMLFVGKAGIYVRHEGHRGRHDLPPFVLSVGTATEAASQLRHALDHLADRCLEAVAYHKLGQRTIGYAGCNIGPQSDDDDAVSGLGDAEVLGSYDEVAAFRLEAAEIELPSFSRRQGNKTISAAATFLAA